VPGANHLFFRWESLGDLEIGRPNLGMMAPVLVYRLMLYTMRTVLTARFGLAETKRIFVAAGRLAGEEFCRHLLNTQLEFDKFLTELQEKLVEHKIGILRVEELDIDTWDMTLTVAEDLDCSGLPVSNETVCDYDEGFLGGILKAYTGNDFRVEEIDCWAKGDRVCRFKVNLIQAN